MANDRRGSCGTSENFGLTRGRELMCTVIRRGTRCLLTLSHKLPTCLNRDDTASQVVHQIINTGNTTMRYLAPRNQLGYGDL